MRTRFSSNLVGEFSRNRRRSKQPFNLEEPLENQAPLVVTMADQRTMAELLRVPTEGYVEAIVVPPILAEHFELKHSLINMINSDQFFELEKDNPHDHIRWFNKITSTIKYKDMPNSAIKLMLFPFSFAGAARRWLEKEPPRSILTWEDLPNYYVVNQQTSAVNTPYDAILKQFQATPPPASVKAVEEICVTCGGAHPYYQCVGLETYGNELPLLTHKLRLTISPSEFIDDNYLHEIMIDKHSFDIVSLSNLLILLHDLELFKSETAYKSLFEDGYKPDCHLHYEINKYHSEVLADITIDIALGLLITAYEHDDVQISV
ncbi:hypothetical protein Tco_0156158 [Tanacetum coccineum]